MAIEVREVMNPQEVSEYLHCSLRLVYRQIRNKTLPSVRLGDRYFLSKAAVDKFLAGECKPTTG